MGAPIWRTETWGGRAGRAVLSQKVRKTIYTLYTLFSHMGTGIRPCARGDTLLPRTLPLPPAAPYSRLSTRPWRKRCRVRGMGRGREVRREVQGALKAEAPPEARTTEGGMLLQRAVQREGSPMGSPTECCGNSLLGLDAPGAKKTLSMRGSGAAAKILAG